jgi:6-phosphogluconate dehydrogenase (decarboxylating)
MKIAIIGGGWVGCHLAYKLRNNHDVVIYEKNDKLFLETSYNNQNRLHNGYHYARNYRTRNLCISTFENFINDYGFLIGDIDKNYYCVPGKKSFIDFKTYLQIFENKEKIIDVNILQNIDGCINTNEKYINFKKAHIFFNNKLSDLFVQETICKNKLKRLLKKFDLVINATNNTLKDKKYHDSFLN